MDPNLVVLWNTDADECGQIFIRVRVSCQVYITLALVFQAHIDVGCGDL